MNKITKYLNQHIVGNVYDKPSILDAYSTDRSILKILPKFVAVPETTEDVCELLKFSYNLAKKHYSLPVTVRGSGLDKTGADLGTGLLISTEKLNQVQEIDERSRLVRVQAGVTLGDLNQVLAIYGLTIPVQLDPKETIGGLISNFPTDPAAKKYGSIYFYVDRLEAVLATGDIIQTIGLNQRTLQHAKELSGLEGKIYREVEQLLDREKDLIATLSRKELKSTGYQMITQVRGRKRGVFDLLPLFFAAQGTLGVITEVILKCEPIPRRPIRMLVSFNNIRPTIDFLQLAASFSPARLDIYDARVFHVAAESGKDLEILNEAKTDGFYALVSFDDFTISAKNKVKKCLAQLKNAASIVVENDQNTYDFAELDNALASYLNNDITGERVALMDNVRIPSDQLPSFLTELRSLEQAFKHDLPIYGSFATSSYTVRPELRFDTLEDRQTVMSFLRTYSDLVLSHKGSVAGSGSEGRTKAIITTPKLSPAELQLYKDLKHIFDEYNILNPDVKLGANLSTTVKHLRTSNNSGITK